MVEQYFRKVTVGGSSPPIGSDTSLYAKITIEMKKIIRCFCCLFCFLFLASPVCATETTLFPVRDTYVTSSNVSHGFEQTLLIENGKDGDFSYRTYVFVIFNIKSLPEDSIVDKAELSFVLTEDVSGSCSVQVQRQGEPWNENENFFSLGYTNTGKIYDITFIVGKDNYSWDITELVKNWKDEEYENNGVVMFASDECKKLFGSKDNSDESLRPKLKITYHLPPTPTPSPKPTVTPSPKPTLKPSVTPLISPTEIPIPTETPTFTPTPIPGFFSGKNKILIPIFAVFIGLILIGSSGFFFIKKGLFQKGLPPSDEENKGEENKNETEPPTAQELNNG